ncbi:MAG: glycerol-3-phosphate acyltransferase [Actinobacteria bacterium]|nr:glycerol-3-phosphate acyltransferase [Actinomycetota bacterium]
MLYFILGYLFGSIDFAYLVTYFLTGKNIREIGDKNPGAANVSREIGKRWGILVWLGDLIKGVIPMEIAAHFGITNIILLTVIGIFAIIGHCYPVFMKFKGGKGVATTGGVLAYIAPAILPVGIILWFVVQIINDRSVRILIVAIIAYFLCLFAIYPLHIVKQISVATILLVITQVVINRDILKEFKF